MSLAVNSIADRGGSSSTGCDRDFVAWILQKCTTFGGSDTSHDWFGLETFMLEVSSSKPLVNESKGFAFLGQARRTGLA
ncbi:hypothetical protein H5410_063842 [Solanum commersonii]|uniref:Uncharacterized protein n=1 Tax=Solanum commersonii TaxID=4109 RepID=A0A9J5WFR1_SOLCO|nr:hypothetical protein H5410_063842 [Solanum commersonii]